MASSDGGNMEMKSRTKKNAGDKEIDENCCVPIDESKDDCKSVPTTRSNYSRCCWQGRRSNGTEGQSLMSDEWTSVKDAQVENTKKYICLSCDTKPDDLYKELIAKYWKLKPPNFLISLLGEAGNCSLTPQMRKVLRQLIPIAGSKGAWIFTSGIDSGLRKYIGKLVREHGLKLDYTYNGDIVGIGSTALGLAELSATLLCDCVGSHRDNKDKLDCNHTHHTFVDNGTHGRGNFEKDLRVKLETYMTERSVSDPKHYNNGGEIPMVYFMLGDGYQLLEDLHNSVDRKISCVLIEGSGRVSDFIAGLVKGDVLLDDSFAKKLKVDLFKCTGKLSGADLETWIRKIIQDILHQKQWITVMKMDKIGDETVKNTIFSALQKAKKENKSNWKGQMLLFMEWDMLDRAREELYSSRSQCEIKDKEDLNEAMFTALVTNRPNFVRLLLENGFQLCSYLDDSEEIKLFSKYLSEQVLKNLEKANKSCSNKIQYVYDMVTNFQTKNANVSKFSHREYNLFIWAILQNKQRLSEVIWEKVPGGTAAALGASNLLKKMAQKNMNVTEAEAQEATARIYENKAAELFSECYKSNAKVAEEMLLYSYEAWEGKSCLKLAVDAKDQDFIAQPGVQDYVSKLWNGQIATDTPIIKVLVCMFIFPLINTDLIFFREKSMNRLEKYKAFYTAPLVVFIWSIFFYIGFLFLFAHVLLMNFQPVPDGLEIFLYVLVFILLCEEVRQMYMKKSQYFSDHWNYMDMFGILFFIFAAVFRIFTIGSSLFYVARVFFCLDYMIFTVRLIHIFIVSRDLGPKIIMLKRMLLDVFLFLFLFVVLAVAIGVARQGILRHNEHRWEWIFRAVIYEPYLAVFGNFPSDMDGTSIDFDQCTMTGNERKPLCVELGSDDLPRFPEWLTVLLLCIYMLFINILLVNLLTAMFGFTIGTVQENNEKTWKFQRYFLVQEYSERLPVPFPLVIFAYIYTLCKKIQCCYRNEEAHKPTECCSNKADHTKMLEWEAAVRKIFLAKTCVKEPLTNEQMDIRLQHIEDKINGLARLMREKSSKLSEPALSQPECHRVETHTGDCTCKQHLESVKKEQQSKDPSTGTGENVE